jgi:TRAP-type uncharacterized transport system fused permease subunit
LTGSIPSILFDVSCTVVGVVALSAGAVGYIGRRIPLLWRTILLAGSVALLLPPVPLRLVGLVGVAIVAARFAAPNEGTTAQTIEQIKGTS